MAIRHLTDDDELATAIIRQLDLWEKISQRSHRQLGPWPVKGAVDDLPLGEFVAVTAEQQRKSVRETAPGFEYRLDGAKTIVVIATTIYEKFFQYWLPVYPPPYESKEYPKQARAQLNQVWREVSRATQTVLGYFQQPGNIIGFDEFQNADRIDMPYPDFAEALRRWLLAYRQPLLPADARPFDQIYPVTDRQFPFIAFKAPGRPDYSLETRSVYWLGQGLNIAYVDTLPRQDDPRWEEQRLQFTLPRPYLLLCNGVLGGQAWAGALDRLEPDAGDLKPALIILADGVEQETAFPENFYTLVLPAPHDHVFDPDQPWAAARPRLQEMALVFETDLVDVGQAAGADIDWAGRVTRCELAQIDRRRTVLVPAAYPTGRDEAPALDWHVRSIHTLVLPGEREETIGQAEALMRWRLEAEQGLVAGAGAALHWVAARLAVKDYDDGSDLAPPDEAAGDDDAAADDILGNEEGQPAGPADDILAAETEKEATVPFEPDVWFRQALQAPLRQLLANAGIEYESLIGRRVQAWVDEVDAPRHTFRLNAAGKDPLVLDEATDLGLVTPAPEIRRTIRLAANLAWLLILYKFGVINRATLEAN
ncbi:MAG: hypothetical protein AB1801_24770 [Chloroflexota bacterium]